MGTSRPRLIADGERVRIEPADAWWCCRCGHLALVNDHGVCARCAGRRQRRCADCRRRRVVNPSGRCTPCANPEAFEARRIAALVMSAFAPAGPAGEGAAQRA